MAREQRYEDRSRNLQDQLDRLRESANDGARNFRTVYTFYLIISLYILVAVSSTDHELLFRAGDVQMPIINVGVSVVWFFTVVPWILLILHLNLLVQAMFLSRKISRYVSEIDERLSLEGEKIVALGLLFPLPLAHKLADADRRRSTRVLLGAMVFLSVAVLPPLILIYTQVKFLPYQEEVFIWLHRAAVMADIGLLWWLWPRIPMPDGGWREWWMRCAVSTKDRDGRQWLAQYLPRPPVAVTLVMTVLSVFSIFIIADFPGGTMSRLTPSIDSWRDHPVLDRKYDLTRSVLVSEEVAPEILAVHYRAIYESGSEDKIDNADKAGNEDTTSDCGRSTIGAEARIWCEHARPLQLEDRHFRDAELSKSTLCRARFENADLRGANLGCAVLRGAEFQRADLQGAELQRTNLEGAQFQGANLSGAKLRRAILPSAEFQCMEPQNTGSRNTGTENAALYCTNLSRAELDFAMLRKANLRGADLREAKLHGTILEEAELQDANLREADLHGANLREADLHGVDLSGVDL